MTTTTPDAAIEQTRRRADRLVGLAPAAMAALSTSVVVIGLLRADAVWMRVGLWLLVAVPLSRNAAVVLRLQGRVRALALVSSAALLVVVAATLWSMRAP